MSRRLATVLALATMVLLPLSGAAAASSDASLPDIEDEVMCPSCGVALNQAFSPQAERERDFIRAQIERGRSKEEIKQALVREFGRGVLATPQTEESSFNWAAYLVPIGVVMAGALAAVVGLRRWRARPAGAPREEAAELSPDDAARLERDLSKYEV